MSFQIFRYLLSSFQIKTQPATRTHKCLLTVSSSLRHKSKDPILSTRVCSHRWREASPINPRCRRERANFLFAPFSSAPILRSSVTKSSAIVLETASSLVERSREFWEMRTSGTTSGPTVIMRDNSNLLAITYGRMITWRLERRLNRASYRATCVSVGRNEPIPRTGYAATAW